MGFRQNRKPTSFSGYPKHLAPILSVAAVTFIFWMGGYEFERGNAGGVWATFTLVAGGVAYLLAKEWRK